MKNPLIGIIGAKGKMGTAFSCLFRSRGLEVLEADLNTELTPETLIRKADITIFSVPISSTASLIRKLAPKAKKRSLIMDFTSIKVPALQAMMESAPKHCEILGLHPIFGPGAVQDLRKQVFAAFPLRKYKLTNFMLSFLRGEGAIIKITTAKKHDEMMSVIQGLTHISAIATAMVLKDLGFNIHESLDFSSPIYRLRLEMVGRILSQNPQLYAEIAVENPLTRRTISAYQNAISTLAKYVKNYDKYSFIDTFSQAADFLGDFKDDSYHKTSKLMQLSRDIL